MCFSSTASFSAGLVLSGLGVASLKQVRELRQLPFAGIPVFFGIQQIAEGFIWMSFTNPAYAAYQEASTTAFLLFAEVVWPLWVPFSMWMLERREKRRRWLLAILGVGLSLAAYQLYCLLTADIEVSVHRRNIHYTLNFPGRLSGLSFFAYMVCTIAPSFLSSVWLMRVFAAFSLVSFLVTLFFFNENLVSIWCFFAAALSVLVLIILHLQRQNGRA